jgi:DNA-binding LytR/AlgR family response regulator
VKLKTPVIFTTAYDKYAINAFKNNGIDYLLKPLNINDLRDSINKYKDLYQDNKNYSADLSDLIDVFKKKPASYKKRFMIQVGSKIKVIDTDNIAYFYAMDKGVFLKTDNKRNFAVDYSLDKLETILDPEMFFRISRKYIISLKSIKELITLSKSRLKVILTIPPTEDLIISYKRSGALKKWLNK